MECVIGVWDWERRTKQTLRINLDMGTDIKEPAKTDGLKDTLSYKDVSKRVQNFVAESSFELIETLAESVAEILLTEFQIPWCRVKINKRGAVRGAGDVGVLIERGEKS